MKNRANYYLIISAGVLMNWGCNQAPTDSDLLTGLKEDVFFLAADDLGGRAIGTEGEQKAADYLEAQFKEIGCSQKVPKDFFSLSPYLNQPIPMKKL